MVSASDRSPMTVAIRVRPLLPAEKLIAENNNTPQSSCVSVDHQHATVIVEERRLTVDLRPYVEVRGVFPMDYTFDASSKNIHVYLQTIRPQLLQAIKNHERLACFAFGQTGSGKTFTMMGTQAEHGLYSLAVRDILQYGKGMDLYFSFYEIYGGKTFDLLNDRAALLALEDDKQMVHLKGLSEFPIEDEDTFLELMQQGSTARSTGSTHANDRSSRSHAVALLNLTKKTSKGTIKVMSRFTFIDLAGSERGRDTLNTHNERHQEGAAINRSLLAVKECVRALHSGNQHVPFRGSKLTQVLRESLSGKCATVMIAMVSPFYKHVEDTVNALKYTNMLRQAAGNDSNTASPQTNNNSLQAPSSNGGKESNLSNNNNNTNNSAVSGNSSPSSLASPHQHNNNTNNSSTGGASDLLSSGGVAVYEEVECCTRCGYPIYDDGMTHNCPKASMRCPHCQMGVMKRNFDAHLAECPEMQVACKFCNEEMKRADLESHENTVCQRSYAVCGQCQQRIFPKGNLQKHMTENCPAAKWMCPFCKIVTSKRNAEEHQSTCAARLISCESCGFKVRIGHLKQHRRVCVGTRRLDEIMEQEVHSPKMLDPIGAGNHNTGTTPTTTSSVTTATPPSATSNNNNRQRNGRNQQHFEFNKVVAGASSSPSLNKQQPSSGRGNNNNNSNNNASSGGGSNNKQQPSLAHLRVPTHPALTAMIENQGGNYNFQYPTNKNNKNQSPANHSGGNNYAAPQSLTPPLIGEKLKNSDKSNNSNNAASASPVSRSNKKNNNNNNNKSPQTARVGKDFLNHNKNLLQQHAAKRKSTSASPPVQKSATARKNHHQQQQQPSIPPQRESPSSLSASPSKNIAHDTNKTYPPSHHQNQTPRKRSTSPIQQNDSHNNNNNDMTPTPIQQQQKQKQQRLLTNSSPNSNNTRVPGMSPMHVTECEFCGGKFLENVLQQHIENDCMMVQVQCPFADAGCNHLLERRSLATHLNENVAQHLVLLHSKTQNVEAENSALKERLAHLEYSKKKLGNATSTSGSNNSISGASSINEASSGSAMSTSNIAAILNKVRRQSGVFQQQSSAEENDNTNKIMMSQDPSASASTKMKPKLKSSKQQVQMTVVKRQQQPSENNHNHHTHNASASATTDRSPPNRLNSTQQKKNTVGGNTNMTRYETPDAKDSFRSSSPSSMNDDVDDEEVYSATSTGQSRELGAGNNVFVAKKIVDNNKAAADSPPPMELNELLSQEDGGDDYREDEFDDDQEDVQQRKQIRKDERDLEASETFLEENRRYMLQAGQKIDRITTDNQPKKPEPKKKIFSPVAEVLDEEIDVPFNNNNHHNHQEREDEKYFQQQHHHQHPNQMARRSTSSVSGRNSSTINHLANRKPSFAKYSNELIQLSAEPPAENLMMNSSTTGNNNNNNNSTANGMKNQPRGSVVSARSNNASTSSAQQPQQQQKPAPSPPKRNSVHHNQSARQQQQPQQQNASPPRGFGSNSSRFK